MAASQLKGIPVLIYHGLTKVGEPGLSVRESKYWVTASRFEEQMKQIRRGKYDALSLKDWFRPPQPTPPGIAITFDDGRVSDYELAFPLLLEHGMTATFFLNVATIGAPGYLTWSQARNMQQYGMSFQSHSSEHVYLTHLSGSALDYQLRHSRQMMEDKLGSSVELLAPPYGRFNERVIAAAYEAGYRAICSGKSWPACPGSSRINRVVVYRCTTFRTFERILSGDPLLYVGRAARTMALEIPKSFLFRFWPAALVDTVAEARS